MIWNKTCLNINAEEAEVRIKYWLFVATMVQNAMVPGSSYLRTNFEAFCGVVIVILVDDALRPSDPIPISGGTPPNAITSNKLMAPNRFAFAKSLINVDIAIDTEARVANCWRH